MKQHFNARLRDKAMDRIERYYATGDYKSKSDFIEKAVNFYGSYLDTQDCTDFLGAAVDKAVAKHIENAEDHIAKTFFRQAVELDMMSHIVAATNEIDMSTLGRLRGMCADEVKLNMGKVRFEDSAKTQKG